MAAVTSITSVEPTHADSIPACSGLRDGKLLKKSQDRPYHQGEQSDHGERDVPALVRGDQGTYLTYFRRLAHG
jgi:hypothetical protein